MRQTGKKFPLLRVIPHLISKVYWALCHGHVPDEGTVSARLLMPEAGKEYRAFVSPRGKDAVTLFRTLRRFAPTEVTGNRQRHDIVQ